MEASSSSSYSSLSSSRTWRTAFLSLRDELLTSPASSTVIPLLHRLIFSQSETLIAAARDLPPHEVTSDAMFLVELGRTLSDCGEDVDDMIIHTFTQLSYLIYNFSQHVTFEITSSSWALLLDSFGRMVEIFLGKACLNRFFSGNVTVIKAKVLFRCCKVYASRTSENKFIIRKYATIGFPSQCCFMLTRCFNFLILKWQLYPCCRIWEDATWIQQFMGSSDNCLCHDQ